MGKNRDFHDYIMFDLFSGIEGITSKSMFGGFGFWRHGKIFAIIADGRLYFKVGEGNKKNFEKHGSRPFVYKGHKGRDIEMSYYELPPDVMEDREQLETWIEKSTSVERKK